MNWFERYGIVGMYFLIIVSIWYVCLFPEAIDIGKLTIYEIPIKYIAGLFTFLFLPIGYIIMILSQRLYYWIPSLHTHKKIFRKLTDKTKNKIELNKEEAEWKTEAVLTYYDRMKFNNRNEKSMEFLAPFITKRFDVIAINNGMILASLLAALLVIIIKVFTCTKFEKIALIALILTLVLCAILNTSRRILEKQIIEIKIRVFEDNI